MLLTINPQHAKGLLLRAKLHQKAGRVCSAATDIQQALPLLAEAADNHASRKDPIYFVAPSQIATRKEGNSVDLGYHPVADAYGVLALCCAQTGDWNNCSLYSQSAFTYEQQNQLALRALAISMEARTASIQPTRMHITRNDIHKLSLTEGSPSEELDRSANNHSVHQSAEGATSEVDGTASDVEVSVTQSYTVQGLGGSLPAMPQSADQWTALYAQFGWQAPAGTAQS